MTGMRWRPSVFGLALVLILCGRAIAQDAPVAAEETAAAAPAAAAPAEAEAVPEDGKRITMNFQDIELSALVKFISEITGKNFILDDRVKGKITIISPEKITVEEAYAVFQSVLQVKGFTTVPSGAISKILPAQEAKTTTLETFMPRRATDGGDEFITKLMPLENVDVNNMLPIIQPLVSPNGLLAAYAATNTLILIDSAANIDRIGRILHSLDVEGQIAGVEVMRLNYAFAAELAAILAQVLEEDSSGAVTTPATAAGAGAPRTTAAARRAARRAGTTASQGTTVATGGEEGADYKIIPDERTNTLIVVASPLEMRRIKDLVVRLDVPLPHGTGRIHVYYLKHANAFEIVPVLSDLIGASSTGPGGLGGGLLSRGIGGSTAFRGGRLGQRGGFGSIAEGLGNRASGNFGGGGIGNSFQRSGGLGSRFGTSGGGSGFGGGGGSLSGGGFSQGVGGQGIASVTGGGTGEFIGEVRITADPSTNTLIVNSSPQDFETLKRVIEQLDVPRRQVYVEAIVMEVRLGRLRELGIELQGATGLGTGVGLGRTNFANINSAAVNPAGISGLILAAASNQTVRLPDGTVVPAQIALLTAAQTDTDVNILSAPNILTTDNLEAEIVVGQNVPFIASRSSSETNLNNTFATVERRDVGITLRITPQISDGGMVRLDIFQEVSALVDDARSGIDVNLLGPTTTIRSATTSVVVRDNHTVVIGGLISDEKLGRRSTVPFIGDIPIIKNFFSTTGKTQSKINLLIFLTPHIVRNPAEHRAQSIEQRDRLRAFMQQHKFSDLRPEYLDAPTWNPDLSEYENKEEHKSGALFRDEPHSRRPSDTADSYAELTRDQSPALPEQAIVDETAALSPPPVSAAAPGLDIQPEPELPPATVRFVLLASFAESGTAPEGLRSNSGLLALELADDSRLTTLFKPGKQYHFNSDTFDGLYHCLDAYATANEAMMVYPEGMPVDPKSGEYLHWRQFRDATSANAMAWTELR